MDTIRMPVAATYTVYRDTGKMERTAVEYADVPVDAILKLLKPYLEEMKGKIQ